MKRNALVFINSTPSKRRNGAVRVVRHARARGWTELDASPSFALSEKGWRGALAREGMVDLDGPPQRNGISLNLPRGTEHGAAGWWAVAGERAGSSADGRVGRTGGRGRTAATSGGDYWTGWPGQVAAGSLAEGEAKKIRQAKTTCPLPMTEAARRRRSVSGDNVLLLLRQTERLGGG
ncbi:hypothetical protein BDY21DRAFT_190429 [Lineolata rhizophorae]|uniref:Uncharacterized protein n=1 Tax=Lineolata rhizophorae TaxID=578093 RepID=A0A6A6P5Z7_9PEZI|nr:hypothetical protein BDY21DRAFT_190429 [Lineolata rhizophorae]